MYSFLMCVNYCHLRDDSRTFLESIFVHCWVDEAIEKKKFENFAKTNLQRYTLNKTFFLNFYSPSYLTSLGFILPLYFLIIYFR